MNVTPDTHAQRAPKSKGRALPERQFSLESLSINRFRNLAPGTKLRFNSGKNIVLGGTARSKQQVDDCISRQVVVVPYYSIEAWLFQNTEQLVEHCKKKCRRSHHQKHKKVLLNWAENPEMLEELEKPKDQYCLKDTKNQELAETSFPWPKLESVGKSFNAFVKDLQSRPRVVEVLSLTA